jgi:S-adenosylmethionine decarboxylase
MNGIEWIVEAHGCSVASLADLSLLRGLFGRIIADLNLRPVGETQWHQFPHTGGITGLCLLAESHLACHTFPEFASLCLNLFCCVPRAAWDFSAHLQEIVGAESVTIRSVARPYSGATKQADGRLPVLTTQPPTGSVAG